MAKRLTPKQRVLKRWPDAVCGRLHDRWWVFKNETFMHHQQYIGYGIKPNQAWSDAASRLEKNND